MQIFKSKLAKTETATVQLNADEILKLKKGVGAPLDVANIDLPNGVSMHQLPNRWFKVEADNAPVSKVQRIEAALELIDGVVNGTRALVSIAIEAPETQDEPAAVVPMHGGGHSTKTPPSQLLMKMFSRVAF